MTRAAKGDGSYRLLPSGHWQYRFQGTQGTGKDRTQKSAREAWKRNRERHDPAKTTVKQYSERWLVQIDREHPPTTLAAYRSYLAHHILPVIGTRRIAALDVAAVRAVMDAAATAKKQRRDMKSGLSVSTRADIRVCLSAMLTEAVKEGLLLANPVARVPPPRIPEREVEPFTPDEVEVLMAKFAAHPLGPLFTCTLALALRMGEALGLRWPDIMGGTVHLRTQLIRVQPGKGIPGYFTLMPLKSGKSRMIALPQIALDALGRVPKRESWNDLIFTDAHGHPLYASSVGEQFRDLLKDSGLPRRKFHALRHTGATLLADAGLPLKDLSTMLGHSGTDITSRVYVHALERGRERAASMMDSILIGSPPQSASPDIRVSDGDR